MEYKTIFISDIHLGMKASRATELLNFLKYNESETLYLVGDIIDGWAINTRRWWPQEHNDVIQKILRKARKRTKVIYIPGNHDEFMREFLEDAPLSLGNITIRQEAIHNAINGKQYLVIHGDRFDVVMQNVKWAAHLGSWAYDISIWINMVVNKIRNLFGLPHWSLSNFLKYKVKSAVNFIGRYEDVLSEYAKYHDVDGCIVGHIHAPSNRMIGNIHYMNCGDWVENTSAIVEHFDGTWELIDYENINSN